MGCNGTEMRAFFGGILVSVALVLAVNATAYEGPSSQAEQQNNAHVMIGPPVVTVVPLLTKGDQSTRYQFFALIATNHANGRDCHSIKTLRWDLDKQQFNTSGWGEGAPDPVFCVEYP